MVNLLSGGRASRKDEPPLTPDALAFVARSLSDVRAWAATRDARLPLASRYRTPALAPELEETLTPAGLEAALHELAARRAEHLLEVDPPSARVEAAPAAGHIVVCEIDMSIGEGRSEAASRGLFDVDDRPPWDLWLGHYARSRPEHPDEPIACLLAWVPDECVAAARAGIAANRCRCLYWPADECPSLDAQLAPLLGGQASGSGADG